MTHACQEDEVEIQFLSKWGAKSRPLSIVRLWIFLVHIRSASRPMLPTHACRSVCTCMSLEVQIPVASESRSPSRSHTHFAHYDLFLLSLLTLTLTLTIVINLPSRLLMRQCPFLT